MTRTDPVKVLAVAALIFVLYVLRHAVLLIYVSVLFAIIFFPAVAWIERHRIFRWKVSRGIALLLLIGVVALAIAAFAFFAIPPIIANSQQLATELPADLQTLTDKLRHLPFGNHIADRLHGSAWQSAAIALLASAFKAFGSVTGAVSGILTVLLLTAYFILDAERCFEWALRLLPSQQQPKARDTAVRAAHRAQKWLTGQMLLMLILGTLSAIVFGFLHLRYFYVLAVFAGVANFVPVLGPIATVLVAGIVAALDSWTKVVGVIIFYLIYQQVENSYLTPRIMRSTVGLPGAAVIASLLTGSELAGILGAIVAVPTAALVSVFLDTYVIHPE